MSTSSLFHLIFLSIIFCDSKGSLLFSQPSSNSAVPVSSFVTLGFDDATVSRLCYSTSGEDPHCSSSESCDSGTIITYATGQPMNNSIDIPTTVRAIGCLRRGKFYQ